MSNEYGAIPLSTANAVGASLKKKMGSLTGFAPVDWAETINKLGNKLPERTVSGAVCSFSDGADDVPMSSVKASITAVQAGSGDPSPSNVRAISGFAECDVVHTGKNLWGGGNISGTKSASVDVSLPSGTFMFSAIIASSDTDYNQNLVIFTYLDDATKAFRIERGGTSRTSRGLVLDKAVKSVTFYAGYNSSQSSGDTFSFTDIQIEVGSTATTYESYAGETIPVWMGGKNLFPYISTFPFSGSMSAYFKEFTANGTNMKIPTIHLKEGVTYTLSADVTSTVQPFKFSVGAGSGTYSTDIETASNLTNGRVSVTFTPTASNLSSGDLLAFRFPRYSSSTSADLTITNLQLELGDTATAYEPVRYIYGGELNLTTGVLTVTHEMQTYDGDENWQTNGSNGVYLTIDSSTTLYSNVTLCNIYTCMTAGGSGGLTNNSCRLNVSKSNIMVKNPDALTAEDFITALQSQSMVVLLELATPTTIQLTPEEVRSFLGTNNLWANTGNSEVTYYAQPNIPTEVLYKGQISTTSDYATANFTESVADDEEILVKVYCPARSAVDYKVIKVADIGNGLNVGFNLHTTVNCTITKTSMASYQYSGDYYDIYADVLAYDSAIFN